MITVKLLGGAKKSFGTDKLRIEKAELTIKQLLAYLKENKPKNTIELDINNLLVAVNGVDSSAIDGQLTKLKKGDVVSIIPIIHGGTNQKIQFKIGRSHVNLFEIKNKHKFDVNFLDKLRKQFTHLTTQGVSSCFILSVSHAKKIISLSTQAKKNNSLLSKKLETDIIMRFACTTQISNAIDKVGIKKGKSFFVIAIGRQDHLKVLYNHLKPYLSTKPFENNQQSFLKKQFKISRKQIDSVISKNPLEDLLVEKATVLF